MYKNRDEKGRLLPIPPEERFHDKTCQNPNGCIEWTGSRWNGYGRFSVNGKPGYAHRFAYELVHGSIPKELQIDHICRNRSCVNPDHLRVVTQKENLLCGEGISAVNAKKTQCPSGHEFTPENTYTRPGGQRACRECRRIYWKTYIRRSA